MMMVLMMMMMSCDPDSRIIGNVTDYLSGEDTLLFELG